jgi:protein-disulfide isomerase
MGCGSCRSARVRRAAAEAALCADKQGHFWEMHDQLFAHQQALLPADLAKYAIAIGLDEDAFEHCTQGHETAKVLADDLLAAAELGITGTPAFLVNGRLVSGARPATDFRRVIDEELRTAAGSRGTAAP